jgi:hypothetical protein
MSHWDLDDIELDILEGVLDALSLSDLRPVDVLFVRRKHPQARRVGWQLDLVGVGWSVCNVFASQPSNLLARICHDGRESDGARGNVTARDAIALPPRTPRNFTAFSCKSA